MAKRGKTAQSLPLQALFSALVLLILSGCTPPSNKEFETAAAVVTTSRATASAPRFGDSDPWEWENRAPWDYPVHGIDVSRYQGLIDWQEVAGSGIAFAFIKATEGGDLIDPRFRENWFGAARAGVARGAYHYYYFCRTPEEQARWFISHVPRDHRALPPVLDMEWSHRSPTCRLRPEPRQVRAQMHSYLGLIGRHYGRRPVIYTTVDFYHDNELWRVRGYPFWLRSVAGHPTETYEGQNWVFWQYTGTGRVPGIAGDTDINAFAGAYYDWLKWSGN
ncbi:MAG: GH25 family lysozyme [Pseudomonadota bacterium]